MSPTELHIGAAAPQQEAPKKDIKVKKGYEKPKSFMEKINDKLASFGSVKMEDKVGFFRLLATMINAGISIVKSLHILVDQIENPKFKKIVQELGDEIEGGANFSGALEKQDKVFNESEIGMVAAGEASGQLNDTLLQIATQTEKNAQLASRVKGAMIYPIVVVLIMLGATYAIMTFVMPRIKEMFEGLGGDLPAMTTALINASDFMVSETYGMPNALLSIIVLVVIVVIFGAWKKTKGGKVLWSKAVLNMPVVGKISQKMNLARFCRTLSTLAASGVSIIKALRITADSMSNEVYKKRIHAIADDVKQGITMGENLQDDVKLFPSMVVGMINVAEQTAQLDSMTARLADFYEDQVDNTVKNLSSLIEPVIIVVLGGSVGFLVIAVMLPILQSSDLAAGT